MVEFKPKEGSRREYDLLIDGRLIEGVYTRATPNKSGTKYYWSISVRAAEAARQIASCPLSEYLPLEYLDLALYFDAGLINSIYISPRYYRGRLHLTDGSAPEGKPEDFEEHWQEEFDIAFGSAPRLTEWARPYSYRDYCRSVERVGEGISETNVEIKLWHDGYDGGGAEVTGLSITFPLGSTDRPLSEEIEAHIPLLRELHEQAEQDLTARTNSDSVVRTFNFPEDVAVPCEQYLLYFVQFLRDLGVEATSELKHKAGKVLFTVTPTSRQEALHKIRVALDEYLRLPFSPISTDSTSEVAIQRLESSVLRLQSDLKLAAAELQAKNATVEAQQLTINIQKAILSGELPDAARRDATPKARDEDSEDVLGGAVTLKPVEKYGLQVNIPTLFRRLKEWIAEDEE